MTICDACPFRGCDDCPAPGGDPQGTLIDVDVSAGESGYSGGADGTLDSARTKSSAPDPRQRNEGLTTAAHLTGTSREEAGMAPHSIAPTTPRVVT